MMVAHTDTPEGRVDMSDTTSNQIEELRAILREAPQEALPGGYGPEVSDDPADITRYVASLVEYIKAQHGLSSADRTAFANIFRNTPMVALATTETGSAPTHPATVSDIVVQVQSIVNNLKRTMRRAQEAEDRLADIERDFAATGRILARMGLHLNADDKDGTDA